MKKAIYAFSGDPITYGHINVIKRSLRVFDELVVGIGVNPEKRYNFSLEERTDMAKKALYGFPNVQVVSFSGLLADYAYKHGINVIIRGFRDAKDIADELNLYNASKTQVRSTEMWFIPAEQEMTHISSSIVKSLQKEHGLTHELVPLYVKQCLEAKISQQYVLGVTGEIGAGKSYVSQKFEELGKNKNVEVHNIELDHLAHNILKAGSCYSEDRKAIVEAFGNQVKQSDGSIDRKVLGDIVFNDPLKLMQLNKIMYQPILIELRQEIRGKQGLILVNAALLAESGMTYLSNNHFVLVTCDATSQEERLKKRKGADGKLLTKTQIKRRLASQYTAAEKKAKIEERIKENNHGNIWIVDNSDSSDPKLVEQAFDEIIKELKVK